MQLFDPATGTACPKPPVPPVNNQARLSNGVTYHALTAVASCSRRKVGEANLWFRVTFQADGLNRQELMSRRLLPHHL